MKFTKLNASLVDGSGFFLSDDKNIQEEIREMFEDKIGDYVMFGNGEETCLQLLGDDIRPPLTGIYGTFTHNGNEYGINIPNDSDYPVRIRILLDSYGSELAGKIAIMNIELRYNGKNINIKKTEENDYEWKFHIEFEGEDYSNRESGKMKKLVSVSKNDGDYVIDDIKKQIN